MALSYNVEVASKVPVLFGEAPFWDPRRGRLIFTDCFAKSVAIFDPSSGEIIKKPVRLAEGDFLYTMFSIPYSSSINKFLVATSAGKLVEFDWELEQATKTLYALSNPLLNFEDGKCDCKGRLWTGTACFKDIGTIQVNEGMGEIYNFSQYRPEQEKLDCVRRDGNFDVPNGLGWNKERTKLFYNDLTRRVVNVFDFDENSGEIRNRKVLFDFKDYPLQLIESSMPDGLCIDESGNVWVACWQGGSVIKIEGGTGKLLEKIDLPVSNVTSCVFGGENYDTLYITTTSVNLDLSPVLGEPQAGKLFKVTNEKNNSFKGFQENFY